MKLKFTTASLRYLLLFDEKLIRVLASHLPPHLPLASHPSWSVLKTMTDVSSDEGIHSPTLTGDKHTNKRDGGVVSHSTLYTPTPTASSWAED